MRIVDNYTKKEIETMPLKDLLKTFVFAAYAYDDRPTKKAKILFRLCIVEIYKRSGELTLPGNDILHIENVLNWE